MGARRASVRAGFRRSPLPGSPESRSQVAWRFAGLGVLAASVSALAVGAPVAAAAASASGTTGTTTNATTATTPVASVGTTTTTINPNPDPPAGTGTAPAAATGTATVHVAFSTVSRTTVLPTTYGSAPPHDAPTGPTTAPTGAVKQGAQFTLETGTGPNPANLHATAASCTTNGTGACTISTAAGTYWVVETTTPAGDATSAPVQATATATTTTDATVTMVPYDCSKASSGASGRCVFTYFAPASPPTTSADGLESLGYLTYTYDATTHVLTLKVPGVAVIQPATRTAKFRLCYDPIDLTFGVMAAAKTTCASTASAVLTTKYGAHLTTYTGTPTVHLTTPANPTTATKNPNAYAIYHVVVPSGSYWFLDSTCGGKLLQVADPAVTPTPVTPTVTTAVSATSVTTGTAVTDAATVTGTAGGGAPAGTVTFSLCGPTSAAQPCTPTATNTVGSGPVALAAGAGDTATATSAAFTPTSAGTWCFAAVYTPASGSPYGSASDDVTGTAVASECVTVSAVAHSSGSNATVASATTIDTGMPWAGSAPFVAGGAALGGGMVLLGLGQRRRYRRVTKTRP